MTTPPQDHNDMEDPQVGEILPSILYEAWWEFSMQAQSRLQYYDEAHLKLLTTNTKIIKVGMEICFGMLKPLMQAALPCVEAVARDTRLKEADGALLLVAAQIKELTQ